ncbi:MAG: esterase-like activity of phytase family protein [Candidatus Devosia phytovorans]|uniref:Esterase-like activity of phytase family protein n=1 Tax=Candidatus Devosia phytovorans TaxID=3121372 RepID=A0AAJ5VWR3_9HYPH|nr:esterase-like activity of phytase family protein [Devosia sp.]WEK05832.1 MAG: esterase-like activity of phytase family protein [Devosia sp.]
MFKSIALAAAALVFVPPAMAQELKVDLLGSITLPTGLKLNGVEFGGISGLDYDPVQDLYYAISDDRSQKAPARFYTLRLPMDAEGLHAVDVVSTVLLRDAAGNVFAEGAIDPESIRYNPLKRSIFWSTENDASGNPAVYESLTDGTFLRAFAVPEHYNPDGQETAGIFGNLGFESLTVSADGANLLTATENALIQDGGKATLDAGSKARIMAFDIVSGAPTAEYLYETDVIHAKATAEPPYNDNGISEMLQFDDEHLLVVERSFAAGLGNQISFYLTALDSSADVTGQATMEEGVEPLGKTLAFVIKEGDFGLDIDNVESVTFGPEIDGRKTLVIASDNNFNANGQFTQFVAFTLTE